VFVSSLSLLIRAYNRARRQAEILLSALCKKAEPALSSECAGCANGPSVGIGDIKSADAAGPPVLTQAEVEREIEEAKTFTPPLEHLIIATTAPQDANIQAFARELSTQHAELGLFKVHVLAWPEIKARLVKHKAILGRFYPSASGTAVHFHESVSAMRDLIEQLSNYRFAISSLLGAVVVLGVIWTALWVLMQGDRAFVALRALEFDPSIPLADKRVRIVLTLKNSGGNYATIEGMATDRKNQLPTEPKYELANITPVDIPAGEELRIISDFGPVPLVFTQQELTAGETSLKVVGFVRYRSNLFNWFLFGNAVLGFCYVWDPHDTDIGNFSVCREKQFSYRYNYRFSDGISIEEVPMLTVGAQTVSPTTAPLRFPDPRFPIKQLETRIQ
jgi:hypothetical protein